MSLSQYQAYLLRRLQEAFNRPVLRQINPESDVFTPEFENAFRTRLLFHHTVTDQYLNKRLFEYAFRDAMVVAGHEAVINTDGQARSYDVLVRNQKFSLKTEGASNIRKSSIHISKLMECAWLRYVEDNAQLIDDMRRHVLPHFEEYDRILNLRIFPTRTPKFAEYILIEIPKLLFEQLEYLEASDFTEPTRTGTRSARVLYQDREAYTIRFDGSDEKITIARLQVEQCIFHGSWQIPILFQMEAGDDTSFQQDLGL